MMPCQFLTPRVTVPARWVFHFGQVDDPVGIQEGFENLGFAIEPGPFDFHIHQFFFVKIYHPVRSAPFGRLTHAGRIERRFGPAHMHA